MQVDRLFYVEAMETALRLLMRDGAVHVHFQPRLTAEQYAELATVIERPATKEELRSALQDLAQRWGSSLSIED